MGLVPSQFSRVLWNLLRSWRERESASWLFSPGTCSALVIRKLYLSAKVNKFSAMACSFGTLLLSFLAILVAAELSFIIPSLLSLIRSWQRRAAARMAKASCSCIGASIIGQS